MGHETGEARTFYAQLGERARVGMEASGCTAWFERLLAEVGHELWVGDPAEIRARAVRWQKTDGRDAEQLLKHLQKLVGMRTSVKNQLHYLAMSQGV